MELLLKKDIEVLGRIGDIVNVAPGYARNYLLPKKLCVPVTPENLRLIEKEKAKAEAEAVAERGRRVETAKKLGEVSVTVVGKANEEGTLFGSITQENVAEALAAEGHPVPPEAIGFAEEGREFPIKEVGVFLLRITLDEGVEADTKLWVVQE
jgi:large subunit ribosomal protein L9